MAVFLGWLTRFLLYVLIVAVGVAFAFWEKLEQVLHRRLEEWVSRSLGATVRADVAQLRFKGIELRNVHIGNSAGEFNAPYFLRLRLFRVRVEGLFQLLTLPGIVPLFGGVFGVGFCTRTIETIEVEGMEVFIEQKKGEDDRRVSNCSFVFTVRQRLRERKNKRRDKVKQRRQAFRKKWGADKDQTEQEKQEEENEEEEEKQEEEVSLDDLGSSFMESLEKPDGEGKGGNIIQRLDRFRKGAANSLEDSRFRLAAATTNHIGRITFKDWSAHVNGRRLMLSEEGWELRGFTGSRADLVRIMGVRLMPKLVRQGVKEQIHNLRQNVSERVSNISRGVTEKLQERKNAMQEKATERLGQRREKREEKQALRQERKQVQVARAKVGGFLQRFGRRNNQQQLQGQQDEQSPQSQPKDEEEEEEEEHEEHEEQEELLQQQQQQQLQNEQ